MTERANRILVVDDERLIRWAVSAELAEHGYEPLDAATATEALAALDRADAVVLDYALPDGDGLTVLSTMLDRRPGLPVVMLTAHSSVEHAVEAMRRGARDYIAKPFDLMDVVRSLGAALDGVGDEREREREREKTILPGLLGRSDGMSRVREQLARIAGTGSAPVLIAGEPGTGKHRAASCIHRASGRADGPLVRVTCVTEPADRLERALFGHEPGAFPGATTAVPGLLEQAAGGTVVLSELAEADPGVQAKLLRFLEEGALRRLGGTEDIRPDVRVIATSTVDLQGAADSGIFQRELYQRFEGVIVQMPPLRHRLEDIDELADHFLDSARRKLGSPARFLSSRARQRLLSHHWPGNVGELRICVQQAATRCRGTMIEETDLGTLASQPPGRLFVLPPDGVVLEDVERNLLEQALERCDGNRTRAAAMLGISRNQMRYRMKKHELGGIR